jgi:hypothetical protein
LEKLISRPRQNKRNSSIRDHAIPGYASHDPLPLLRDGAF